MIHDGFQVLGFSKEEAEQADKLSEIGCINAISPEEVAVAIQRAMSDSGEIMHCEARMYYPPSACDGKPCCACDSFEDMRERRS